MSHLLSQSLTSTSAGCHGSQLPADEAAPSRSLKDRSRIRTWTCLEALLQLPGLSTGSDSVSWWRTPSQPRGQKVTAVITQVTRRGTGLDQVPGLSVQSSVDLPTSPSPQPLPWSVCRTRMPASPAGPGVSGSL